MVRCSCTWKHIHAYNFSTLHHIPPKQLGTTKSQVVSTNIAISQLVRDGQLKKARKLFDHMPEPTVVSWNTMVSAYSKFGDFSEALNVVSSMHHYSKARFNEATFASALSACANSQSLIKGKQLHSMVFKLGLERYQYAGGALLSFYSSCYQIKEARKVFALLHEENEVLWSLMLVGYVQCNLMSEAEDIFNKMPSHSVIAWTTIISGYSKSEGGNFKALELFRLMIRGGETVPNECTLDCVIRTCGRSGAFSLGRIVHGLLLKLGYEFEQFICGALISFYCESGIVNDAKIVYQGLVSPSLNASNALLEGLVMMTRMEEAELIFNGLLQRDSMSYNLMIKGYAMNGQVEQAKRLYTEMPLKSLSCTNTMISVFSRERELDRASELFEETKGVGDPVTWNSMISAYIQNDQQENAVKLYAAMRRSSISPTQSTFSSLLRGCACLGSLQQGQVIHADLIKTPLESNVYVGTALVDMYSKCGSIADAQRSFVCISCPNGTAWTALINGYATHGMTCEAIQQLEHMLEQGIRPNAATFVAVLSSCNHAGLVNEGMKFFHLMVDTYGITPTLKHYTCIVDLLATSGQLLEAEEIINSMETEADEIILTALLNGCFLWMNVQVGERVVHKIFRMWTRKPQI